MKQQPEFRYRGYFESILTRTNGLKGIFVECGMGRGATTRAYLNLIRDGILTKRDVYALDSFQGLPEGSIYDAPDVKGRVNRPIELVQEWLPSYNDFNINVLEGWFKDTLKLIPSVDIAIAHIDVDIYPSYKECLEYLYPQVVPGGIIMLDEYNSSADLAKWPGAKIAIDEFCEKNNLEVQLSLDWNKAYLIKPL